ncbi:hypothetical protein ABPG75_000301 [Micractinium tetrahymenae]
MGPDGALLLAAGGGGSGAVPFVHSFGQEVQRLRLFLKSSLEALWLALLDACAQLRGLSEELLQGGAASAAAARQLGARLAALKAGFDATGQELVHLDRFLRQNVAACAQLAQMHDQQHRRAGGPELPLAEVEGPYLEAAQGALLGELRMEPLVLGLSDAYELCRLIESDAAALAGRPAHWVPPDRFQRVTRKFWLHPADVMRFKAEVIKHLPVLIFGDRQKLTEGSPFEVAFLRDQQASDSSDTTSVYYDEPNSLPCYHDRLRKDDGASVVRLRWYGERAAGAPGQRIFVERKVHRERCTGEFSYKERAPIEQRYVTEYTSGTGAPPEMLEGPHAEFLQDTQRFLVQGRQVPLMRTVYRRTAFQEASNNLVRISLDTQLHMVREHGAPRAPGDWCRDMAAPLPPHDAVYFPYAVVEIKLQEAPPAWVTDLLGTGMLLPVPKFSKFLHGAALLFQHRCLNVPYWFLPDEHDPRMMSPATWEEMADPADEYLQKGATWLFPRGFEGADGEGPAASEEPVVPYSPAPLRFLRRNKTAPVASSATGGVGVSCAREALPPAGHHGLLPSQAVHVAAAHWGSLQVAGGTGRAAVHADAHAASLAGGPVAPLPLFSPATSAAPTAQQAQQAQQQHGHVARNHTWPVYQNTLALLPPSEPSDALLAPGSLHPLAAAAQPLPPPAAAGAAAAAPAAVPPARPGSPHSQSSTPHDSAQDLEAGRSPEVPGDGQLQDKPLKDSSSGGSDSCKPLPPGTAVAAEAAAPGEAGACFGSLQYRMPVVPPCANGSGAVTAAPAGRAKALVRTRVEPKTFFANERTFLAWLQISVLIMMTATSLLSGSGLLSNIKGGTSAASCTTGDTACFASKLSGAIIAPVALLFMGYALFMYKKRTYQILRRETVRYDDQRGPVVLVVILLLVFTLSYILAMVWIF